ncbi:TonB-dependent receptor [Ideonella sp. B7]|uniref:TonB-dependent receptor n=1 Tax=Ideonella benzenivorans TaxID=2831643 RepID=UPI001CEDE240|nr:TonB-dependent receptor [Ideonella benzenivorans]MCA6217476.1 TonB-dependent receptor [Ideonella benzenivorans]
MIKRTELARSLLIAFGSGAMLAGVPAQAADEAVQRITVTGSNIKRVDSETASPVQTISRQDIEKSGKTSIADVILGLNASNNGSVPLAFGNGFAAGASGVSLRGLGPNATLVLLNGRRMAPYGLADDGQRTFVDLSTIPMEAVDRIEVVKDGASAIYGSDAMGGVVNIITRRDYQGLAANVSYGVTSYGDGKTPKASLTGGFGDFGADKYNVFFTLEAQQIGEILQSDRKNRNGIGDPDATHFGYGFTAGSIRGYKTPAGGASASPWGWYRAVSEPEGQTALGAYTQLALPSTGCPTNYALPEGYSGCTWNTLDYSQLQPKEDKINFLSRGTLDLGDGLSGFAEVGLFKSKVFTIGTPSSVSSTWYDAINANFKDNTYITMSPDHPDNPSGEYARLRYVTADLGGRDSIYDTTVSRALVGLQGSNFGWDWETGLLYTQSKTDVTKNGYLSNSVLRDYLNGTNTTGKNPDLTFYRLGVNAGLNSEATRNAISPTLSNSATTSITSLDAKASRELMTLPGGPMQLAVGAEFRHEDVDSPPTPGTYEADIIGLGYSGFSAKRDVYALYAELSAPVLKNFEITAAARNDHYSDYGNSFTPKLGLKFTPWDELVLRGTFAKGFRAPGPAESGKSVGGSAGYTSYVDPVRCPITNDPVDCGSGETVVVSAANPKVKPEKSDSYTFGFVLEPFKDTSVSLDFWRIKRTNEILGADVAAVLNNPGAFPSATVIRDTSDELAGVPNSGTLLAVSTPYTNGPSTITGGFDLDVRQRFKIEAIGKFTASATWTHVNTFKRKLADGTAFQYAGTYGPTAMSSSSGNPKDKATFSLGWDNGPYSLTGTVNYVSSIRNVEYAGDPNGCLLTFADGEDAPKGCRTPSFTTVDLSGSYKYSDALQVYGSIQNILDRKAPYDLTAYYGSTHYNATYHQAGALGTVFNFGVKYKFY